MVRLSAALIPALLVLSGRVLSARFFEALPSADSEWWWRMLWEILLLTPYIYFAYLLLFESLPMAKLPKYRAEDRRAQHGGDQDKLKEPGRASSVDCRWSIEVGKRADRVPGEPNLWLICRRIYGDRTSLFRTLLARISHPNKLRLSQARPILIVYAAG